MDLFTSMRTYIAVVSAGSFTGGAERLGISKALASKYIGQLEDHLGVRLLNRTTRRLNLTEVGQGYFQRCQQLLDELDELEASVLEQQDAPRGKLKVAAPSNFGEKNLARAVAEYLKTQPNMSIELVLADRFVNLVEEGFDLAVRIGELADSSLIARRLASMRMVVCAAPEYLKKNNIPADPQELAMHNCLIDTNMRDPDQW
ncbi:LysR family transcriptional regulator, partial [Kaarinaea lacus]